MLKQISLYTENTRGAMQKITEILAEANINILGSVTNDSAEYGIVRMVVSDPARAAEAFEKAGYLCRLSNVLGIEIEDRVGEMNRMLKTISDSNISVNYAYLSFNRDSGKPIMVIHTDGIVEVEQCLKDKGYQSL